MENVEALIQNSVALLRNNGLTDVNFSKPHYPTCVVYFGERSSRYHRELHGDITRGWGGNTDYIRFYSLNHSDSREFTELLSGTPVTELEVKKQITEMLSAQNVFAEMNRIALYCLIDTTDLKTAEDFAKWYLALSVVEEIISVPTLSMLMVVLNESLQFEQIANEIKNKIRELYQENHAGGLNKHLYDSVFIFGNRLKNGSFVKHDPTDSTYKNYNLFADLILLTNTRSEDYTIRRSRLYGSNKPALTAAYGFVQKPMAEIVTITLTIILKKLKEMTNRQTIDAEQLMKALQIRNGRSEVNERFYAEIKDLLPAMDFVNWLPGKTEPDQPFDLFNQKTDGCLQKFLEQNHFEVIAVELLNRNDLIIHELLKLISQDFDAAQLNNGVPSEARQIAFDKTEIALGNPDKYNVEKAIELKMKKVIANELRTKSDEALDLAIRKAKICMEQFTQLCSELELCSAVGEEGTRRNLTAFYSEKIQRYFNDTSKLNALFRNLLQINNDKVAMLRILLRTLEVFFESDPVYKLSFSEELTDRLGYVDTERRAQEFIGQELIKDLDDRISFYSMNVFQTRIFEAYFLNTRETTNNLVYKYLHDRPAPPEVNRTFFNTCNNDMAESIWFYHCSTDNLSV